MTSWRRSCIVVVACTLFQFGESHATAIAGPTVPTQPSCTGIESNDPQAATLTGTVPPGNDTAPAQPFVMVFPDNESTENFVTYLASHGKPPVFASGTPASEMFAWSRRQLERMRDIPHATSTMRLAFLDSHGSFHCSGVAPGKYVVLLPVSESTLKNPKAEAMTYFVARATLKHDAVRSRRTRSISTSPFRSIDELKPTT